MAEAAPAPAPAPLSGLELLDADALHAVLSLLDCAALAATAVASRGLRAAAVDDRLWAALLAEAFWDASLHPVPHPYFSAASLPAEQNSPRRGELCESS
jgi:hypothetical protein